MKNKLTFFLMTEKGYYVLEKYLTDFGGSNINCVVIGRDENILNDFFWEITGLCEKYHVKHIERTSNIDLKSGYAIAVSWRWIINTKKIKLIVFHDSLLPKYRGFAPLVNSLINKEKKIGVTALLASEEYDRGGIIIQKGLTINYPIKIKDAITLILPIYYDLVKEVAKIILDNKTIRTVPQSDEKATYSLWRDEDDYNINWSENSHYIKRFIDAVGEPYSGASSFIGDQKVRILSVQVIKDVQIENRTPGKIIFIKKGEPVVVCGEGLLRIVKMIDNESRKDLIPFTKFRVRFR